MPVSHLVECVLIVNGLPFYQVGTEEEADSAGWCQVTEGFLMQGEGEGER